MAISPTPLYTLAEFEALLARPENSKRLLELIDGELREKLPTQQHGRVALRIAMAIELFTVPLKLGRVSVEARHQLPPDEQDTDHPSSRIPDVSYVSKERALPLITKGAVPIMPDLAVEIQSPDQDDAVVLESAEYYLKHGSRMVLLVYPDRRIVEKLPSGAKRLHTIDDVIDFDPVIPGLLLPVKDIFLDPLSAE